jgi:hypothetical protein
MGPEIVERNEMLKVFLLLLPLALTACESTMKERASEDPSVSDTKNVKADQNVDCKAQGFTPGTTEFYVCLDRMIPRPKVR